ncbi:MAG: hypothetical protein ABJP70_12685 [Erythrobacter sp.]
MPSALIAQNFPTPASATEDPDSIDDGDIDISGDGGIVVQGQRLRGQLLVDQAPVLELNEEDIAAEGVTSIADLITQISDQTGSARGRGGGGRPVILINGVRIGSFREFRNYPPEALARVEVFPEEVAQRFGFPPDRRVINLILKESYGNAEVEFEFEGPSSGGNYTREQEFGYLQIADGARINVNLSANDTSLLTEDERSIIQTDGSISDVAGDPDQAPFRSLISDSRNFDANVSWAKAYIDSGTSVSANVNYARSDSLSLQGLNAVTLTDAGGTSVLRTFGEDTPLTQRTAQDFVNASGSLTKPVGNFRLTSTFDSGFSETTQVIANRVDISDFQTQALAGTLALDGALPSSVNGGFDTAFTRSLSAQTLNTLRGPLGELPAGEVLATFDIGFDWQRLQTSDTRTTQSVELTRGDLSTGVNLVVPLTSTSTGFADALGSLSLNAQVGLNHYSDFGTLGDYTLGLTWKPFDNLDLSVNYIQREVAPALSSLGNPEVTNLNVPVFDFTNNESVLATVITGGNPNLLAETQRDWKFAANWELPFWNGARITLEYIRNRSDDVTSAFPTLTPEIEAAFADRVTRDAGGTLLAVDRRPVTFSETRAERLQFGFSKRGTIGGAQRGGQRGGRAQARGGEARGGPSAAGGGTPQGAAAQRGGGERQGRRGNQGAGGPPSADQRAAFMQFRTRICADDGLEVLTRLVQAVENGEDLSGTIPGFDAQRFERLLSRVRGEDGKVDPERLAAMRTRICSFDPSNAGGGGRPGSGPAAGGDGAVAQGTDGPSGAPARGASEAFRARACGDDGLSAIRELIGKIERGEDVSAELPGVDPQFIKLGLDRMRDADGNVPDSALERFRSQFCASSTQQPSQQAGAQNGTSQGGGPAFNPLSRNSSGARYFFSLNHNIELNNEILIAPGIDVLDQLGGQATSAFGFPRHSTRLEAGIFGGGVGMRVSGRYTSSTRLDGTGLVGSSDLFFDDLATVNVRWFTELGQLLGKNEGVLKNFRVSLRADNLFDARRTVTDENGDTPLNYQPSLIDPVGRFIGIDIRKLF